MTARACRRAGHHSASSARRWRSRWRLTGDQHHRRSSGVDRRRRRPDPPCVPELAHDRCLRARSTNRPSRGDPEDGVSRHRRTRFLVAVPDRFEEGDLAVPSHDSDGAREAAVIDVRLRGLSRRVTGLGLAPRRTTTTQDVQVRLRSRYLPVASLTGASRSRSRSGSRRQADPRSRRRYRIAREVARPRLGQ